MNKHIFKAIKEKRFPRRGDLIRNRATGNYINVVVGVDIVDNNTCIVHSVRYGNTNRGDFELLNGHTARSFKLYLSSFPNWEIVKEFVEADNDQLIKNLLSRQGNH